MASTASIYFNKIRIDYPQAGRDNDSQGFRDNFKNIYNAFSATDVAIKDLEVNAVSLGDSNDFGYTGIIKKAVLQSDVRLVRDLSPGPTNGNIYLDYTEASYQKFSLAAGETTFLVQNWPPSGNKAELEVSVTPATTSTTSIMFGGGTYVTVGDITLPVVSNSLDTRHFKIWTDDGGITIYISGSNLNSTNRVYDRSTQIQTSTFNVSYTNSSYQRFSLSTGTVTCILTNFPTSTDTVATVTLSIKTTTTTHASTLSFSHASATIEPVGGHTYPYTIATTATQFFDVWSDNGGSTIYVLKKGL